MTLLNRRSFLCQTIAFSALTATGKLAEALAPAPDTNAHHILIVGDWGAVDPTAQNQVAQAMVSYTQRNSLHTEALFMLGDTWYGDLDGGVDSPRWKTQFEDMYPAGVFPGPVYSIMGNHDHQRMPHNVNKVEAQLAYARRGKSRWTQPSLWYTFDITPPGSADPLFHVIALDSNRPQKIEMIDPIQLNLTRAQWEEQLQWLEAELEKPTNASFRIVMGHHPIFSNGPHGDNKELVHDWEPLLCKHNVPVYLAGHDHDLQHLEFADHPTSFVGSGAGGADLYEIKIPDSRRGPFAHKVYGFTHLEATPTQLTFRHIDAQGKIIHAFTKSKDGKVSLLS